MELCDSRNILAKTLKKQIWSLKMLIALQTETESPAKPGRGRYGTERRGGIAEKYWVLQHSSIILPFNT
jgi:hypothetical protein